MKKKLLVPVLCAVVALAIVLVLVFGGIVSSVRKPGTPPSKPKEAVVWTGNLWKECVEEGKLDTLYYSMPKSWRADFEKKVVAVFAKKMDKELWDAASGLLDDLEPVLRAQAANIVELYNEVRKHDKSMPRLSEEDVNLAAEFIGAVPDALDLSRLRKGDLDGLLGNKTFQKFLKRGAEIVHDKFFKITSVKLDKDDDNAVEFKYKQYLDYSDEWYAREATVPLKKVDGVWVPEPMSENWDETLDGLVEEIDNFDGTVDQDAKKAILAAIKVVRKHLPGIKKAKDADALKDALEELGEALQDELRDEFR